MVYKLVLGATPTLKVRAPAPQLQLFQYEAACTYFSFFSPLGPAFFDAVVDGAHEVLIYSFIPRIFREIPEAVGVRVRKTWSTVHSKPAKQCHSGKLRENYEAVGVRVTYLGLQGLLEFRVKRQACVKPFFCPKLDRVEVNAARILFTRRAK